MLPMTGLSVVLILLLHLKRPSYPSLVLQVQKTWGYVPKSLQNIWGRQNHRHSRRYCCVLVGYILHGAKCKDRRWQRAPILPICFVWWVRHRPDWSSHDSRFLLPWLQTPSGNLFGRYYKRCRNQENHQNPPNPWAAGVVSHWYSACFSTLIFILLSSILVPSCELSDASTLLLQPTFLIGLIKPTLPLAHTMRRDCYTCSIDHMDPTFAHLPFNLHHWHTEYLFASGMWVWLIATLVRDVCDHVELPKLYAAKTVKQYFRTKDHCTVDTIIPGTQVDATPDVSQNRELSAVSASIGGT